MSFIFDSGLKAEPELRVEKFVINGYQVFLIDSPVGNSVRIESFVPRGGFHDPVQIDGVSHYFEHVIHNGSRSFPGASTYSDTVKDNGAFYNASTGLEITRYFIEFHPEAFDTLISLFGDMMTQPLFSPPELEKEKTAVIQEITDYAQRTDMLYLAPFAHLVPPDHYLRKLIPIGVPDSVSRVQPSDIWDIFKTDYRPEAVEVAIIANFSSGEISKEDVLAKVERAFQPHPVLSEPIPESMTPADQMNFDPLIANSQQERLVEFGTNDTSRSANLLFDLPRDIEIDDTALEFFTDYLNLKNEGSLYDTLLKKGWVTSQGIWSRGANNMKFVNLTWKLTEEGSRNFNSIIQMLFAELHRLATEGLRADELQFLINMNISCYREAFQTRSGAIDYFKHQSLLGVDPEEIFDLEKRFRAMTTNGVSKIAALLSPSSVLISHLDPSFSGPESDLFHRPFRTMPIPDDLMDEWNGVFQNGDPSYSSTGVDIGQIPLQFMEQAEQGEQGHQTFVESERGSKLFLLEEHGTRQGSLTALLYTGNFSEEVQAAVALLVSTFSERYMAQLSYLKNIGILRGLSADEDRINFYLKGDAKANQMAYFWILDQLIHFEPSNEEIARALEKLRVAAQEENEGFTASVARRYGQFGLYPRSMSKARLYEILRSNGSAEKLPQLVKSFFSKVTLHVAMVGDYTPKQLFELENRTAISVPSGLSKFEPRIDMLPIASQINFWVPSSANKTENDFGGALFLPGPATFTKEEAAHMIISGVMAGEVFRINRTEGGLGYVHGFAHSSGLRNSILAFYGGTSSKEGFEQMQSGWRAAIQATRAKLTPEFFETIKRAALLKRNIIPGDPTQRADRFIFGVLNHDDPDSFSKRTAAIQALTYEELVAAFDQYFEIDGGPFLFTEVSKASSCQGALQQLSEVRSALSRPGK